MSKCSGCGAEARDLCICSKSLNGDSISRMKKEWDNINTGPRDYIGIDVGLGDKSVEFEYSPNAGQGAL